jgi:hypothetical protein
VGDVYGVYLKSKGLVMPCGRHGSGESGRNRDVGDGMIAEMWDECRIRRIGEREEREAKSGVVIL